MANRLTENNRIIAVGDIHGCLYSLHELLEKLELRETDQLVFLGDYIDRGKYSKEVVDYLIELRDWYSCFFLMGNHELMFLQFLETDDPSLWLQNGGKATLESYGIKDGHDLPETHIEFFRSCLYFLQTKHFFFVHGGLDPEMSIDQNLKNLGNEEFCWIRIHLRPAYLDQERYKWEKTVVCGHTPVSVPIMLDKLIAIDTGCVYNNDPSLGKLTAVILPERTIIQTDNIDS